MKKTLFLLALIACIATSHAQPADGYKKNSVGLDLVPMVQNVVHGDSLIPYSITYRRLLTPRHVVKLRAEGGYKYSYVNYPKNIYTQMKSWGVGVGYEYVAPLLAWVDFNGGLSLAYRWSETSVHTQYQRATMYGRHPTYKNVDIMQICPLVKQYFVMPAVGLNFHVGKHVSTLLEFSPFYTYGVIERSNVEVVTGPLIGGSRRGWGGANIAEKKISATCSLQLMFNF